MSHQYPICFHLLPFVLHALFTSSFST
jgi:hypothetical protein